MCRVFHRQDPARIAVGWASAETVHLESQDPTAPTVGVRVVCNLGFPPTGEKVSTFAVGAAGLHYVEGGGGGDVDISTKRVWYALGGQAVDHTVAVSLVFLATPPDPVQVASPISWPQARHVKHPGLIIASYLPNQVADPLGEHQREWSNGILSWDLYIECK